MTIYIIWLVGVIIWNFGYTEATPLEDVIAAIVLSFISFALKKISQNLVIQSQTRVQNRQPG